MAEQEQKCRIELQIPEGISGEEYKKIIEETFEEVKKVAFPKGAKINFLDSNKGPLEKSGDGMEITMRYLDK